MNSPSDSTEKSDESAWSNIDLWPDIEEQLSRFECAWQQHPEPSIKQFLHLPSPLETAQPPGQITDHDRGENTIDPTLILTAELIKIDVEYRWKKGDEYRAENYFQEFPELAESSLANEIIESELEARKLANRLPDEKELAQRFGGQSISWLRFIDQLHSDPVFQASPNATPALELATINPVSEVKAQNQDLANLESGNQLGRYLLGTKIGEGTFAVVWRATDQQLKRDVAIKVLRKEAGGNKSSTVARLVREGRAAAAIDHDGVVKIHEVVNDENGTYIVEQFIEGKSLDIIIESSLPTPRRSAEIVRDISKAAFAAHECGIVHRDIKPANILMAEMKRPVLVDFGLACLEKITDVTLTQQGELLGTPAYMSPQQATGQHQLVDARSDIYSLGAVLYHLLTGKLPFEGSILTILDSVVNKTPNRTPLHRRGIDRDLETIVLKCLEKEPSDRYPSALALAEDLQRYLDGAPISARPVGNTERLWKWSKRHPKIAGLVATTFVLLAFLLGSLLQLNAVNKQRNRAELAEDRANSLLLDSTKSSARLALQRGKMSEAVENFQKAIELEESDDEAFKLEYVEALLATREIAKAESVLNQIDLKSLAPSLRGKGHLLKARMVLETGEPDQAIELFEAAINEGLPPNENAFAQAMLAERSLNAVRKLEESLVSGPHKHHPRRMLVTLLLSLARFDDANQQLEVAKQLFPDDIDFQLLDSASLTISGQLDQALGQIDTLSVSSNEKQNWAALCGKIDEFRKTYSHRGKQFGFDGDNLTLLAKDYLKVVAPCLKQRGFVFPPKIAIRFADLFTQLERFQQGKIKPEEIWPELEAVAQVHPEGSLAILQLSTLLSQNAFDAAALQLEKVKDADGFVSDSRQMLAEIGLTLALVRFSRVRPDQDRTQLLGLAKDAILELEKYPDLVQRYSEKPNYSRLLSNVGIEALKVGVANEEMPLRWIKHFDSSPQTSRFESLWMEAIVASRAGKPGKAIKLLEEMLTTKSEAPENVVEKLLPQARGLWLDISRSLSKELEQGSKLFDLPKASSEK